MLKKEDQVVLFVKRFNCFANRIKNNKAISLSIATHSIPGINVSSSLRTRVWTYDDSHHAIHPLALFLIGKKVVTNSPLVDITNILTFALSTFRQGFYNAPHYYDAWHELGGCSDTPEYYYSLYFNLGRAFLHKFLLIELPYKLPPKFQKLFEELA